MLAIFSFVVYDRNKESLIDIFLEGKSQSLASSALYVDKYILDNVLSIQKARKEMEKAGLDDHIVANSLKSIFPHTQFDTLYIGYADDGRLIKTDNVSNNIPFALSL